MIYWQAVLLDRRSSKILVDNAHPDYSSLVSFEVKELKIFQPAFPAGGGAEIGFLVCLIFLPPGDFANHFFLLRLRHGWIYRGILKGFNPPAQGCAARATLDKNHNHFTYPERVE
jgi:hypothetical protein